MSAPRLYKVLGLDGSARIGKGKWLLPRGSRPGEWMPPIEGELVACKCGYHLCRRADLIHWIGPAIYEAEYRGERIETDDKIVVREARLVRTIETWNEKTARLFACDCAERALKHYERKYPNDDRPRKAIEIARRFARGEATKKELLAAAYDAAYANAAAYDAAYDAAYANAAARAAAAAYAAYAASAASAAAYAASAAAYATRTAASDAERKWQTEHLFEYLDAEVVQI